jgi:DNA-binding NtrC family response regulator
MSASTTLLVSTDPSLVESVSGVVRSIADLRLRVLSEVEEACSVLQRDGAALVLVHLPPSDPVDRVTPLLQAARASKRPVPVLALGDRHQAARALDLLRRGVVDYLNRPLDLGRLAYLADLLTVRARHEARQAAADIRTRSKCWERRLGFCTSAQRA